MSEPQPLIIIPETEQFLLPQNRSGIVYLNAGDEVELYCTGSFASPITNVNTIIASCSDDGTFLANGVKYAFIDFTCTAYPAHTARATGNSCYDENSMEIEIGYAIGNRFISLMESCHDFVIETNHYVHFKTAPNNYGHQSGFPRPSFIAGNFFGGKNVDTLYTKVNQIAVLTNILGSADLANSLVTESYSLHRGHQAAKADFIFGTHQRTTFYFVNVAPQWSEFNAANWEAVESSTKRYIADQDIHCEIYVGTFGIVSYPDINGNDVEFFLYYDENGQGKIPVPKIFYRVVYDPESGRGVVLIGVNNYHATLEQIESDYIYCNDISDQITWVTWDKRNLNKGYSYACEINEFESVVGHLPHFEVTGLLL